MDVKEGGLTGAETISFCCNNAEVYMIYADDASGLGESMPGSEASISLSQSSGTREVAQLDAGTAVAGPDSRYWLAGCLTIVNNKPEFTAVNRLMAKDPRISEPLFCYNLLKSMMKVEGKESIPVTVTVTNAITSLAVEGAVVKLGALDGSLKGSAAVSVEQGEAHFTAEQAGRYEVLTSAVGFMPDRSVLAVECVEDGFMACAGRLTVSLLPTAMPSTVQVVLNWATEQDVDLFTLAVAEEDTTNVCIASHDLSDCNAIAGGRDSKSGLKAGELITLSNGSTSHSFMLYTSRPSRGARITVSDGAQSTGITLDPAGEEIGDRYWIAGCVKIVGRSYQVYPVNTLVRDDPSLASSADHLLCHNKIKSDQVTVVPETFCEDTPINIVVEDSTTSSLIPGALISISHLTQDSITVVAKDVQSDNFGSATVAVTTNGRHQYEVTAKGYVTNSGQVTCKPSLHN
jgi:hypothetical protein